MPRVRLNRGDPRRGAGPFANLVQPINTELDGPNGCVYADTGGMADGVYPENTAGIVGFHGSAPVIDGGGGGSSAIKGYGTAAIPVIGGPQPQRRTAGKMDITSATRSLQRGNRSGE